MENNELQSVEAWASNVAALDQRTREGIRIRSQQLADDKRLNKADREFGTLQAESIERAFRQKTTRKNSE